VQAMLAEERIQEWGGNVELPQTQETVNKHVCHRLYDSDIGGRPWNKKSLYKVCTNFIN
jgi:hypothetical protein